MQYSCDCIIILTYMSIQLKNYVPLYGCLKKY